MPSLSLNYMLNTVTENLENSVPSVNDLQRGEELNHSTQKLATYNSKRVHLTLKPNGVSQENERKRSCHMRSGTSMYERGHE